jgi:hypothetical protein
MDNAFRMLLINVQISGASIHLAIAIWAYCAEFRNDEDTCNDKQRPKDKKGWPISP